MFSYTNDLRTDEEYLSLDDEKFEYTNVVLELTNKHDHNKLLKYQKYINFIVENNNRKYKESASEQNLD